MAAGNAMRDWLPEDFFHWVDSGTACPRCYQRIQAKQVTALGIDFWRCPHCHADWFNTTKEIDEADEKHS